MSKRVILNRYQNKFRLTFYRMLFLNENAKKTAKPTEHLKF